MESHSVGEDASRSPGMQQHLPDGAAESSSLNWETSSTKPEHVIPQTPEIQDEHKIKGSSQARKTRRRRTRKKEKQIKEKEDKGERGTPVPSEGTMEKEEMEMKASQSKRTKKMRVDAQPMSVQTGHVTPSTQGLKSQGIQTEETPQAGWVTKRSQETQTLVVELYTQHTQTEPSDTTEPGLKQAPCTSVTASQTPVPDHGRGEPGNTHSNQDPDKPLGECPDQGSENSRDVSWVMEEDQGQSVRDKESDGQNPDQSTSSCCRSTEKGRESKGQEGQIKQQGAQDNTGGNRETSLTRPPMFTFHIYAVLGKMFKFSENHDKLLLQYHGGEWVLEMTHFSGMGEEGYLIEARLLVEDSIIPRGQCMNYVYCVEKKTKKILEFGSRVLFIPPDPHKTELHLYEGPIIHHSSGILMKLTTWLSSNPEEVRVQMWHSSAKILLDRIFQKWPPKITQGSIQQFAQTLLHYQLSFQGLRERLLYPDNSVPPFTELPGLIAERLLQFMKGEKSKGPSLRSSSKNNSLVAGLALFQVTSACRLELGVKGWAELCLSMTSNISQLSQNLADVMEVFTSPKHTVIGLMNLCARKLVAELPRLVPFLLATGGSEPGVNMPDPKAEEQGWAGLEGVEYAHFRERIRRFSEKRRIMLEIIKGCRTWPEKWPQLCTSWLSLVATEDVVQFSVQTSTAVEHLVQTLMYRLRQYEKNISMDMTQEMNLQVAQNIINHILEKLQDDRERILGSGFVKPLLQCCITIHRSICGMAQLVPQYKPVVISYQLVLKMAEIQHTLLEKAEEKQNGELACFFSSLEDIQGKLCRWRDRLLSKPLVKNSDALSYPKELELWDSLLKVECSVQKISDDWKIAVERDLRSRVSQPSTAEKVLFCCQNWSLVRTHSSISPCLQELSQSAIKSICQEAKEGDLMETLSTNAKAIPSLILSSILIESTVRFRDDPVGQLLQPQSALYQFLSSSAWDNVQVNQEASQVLQSGQATLDHLEKGLYHGHIPLGHLQATVKHQTQFKKLYLKHKKSRSQEFQINIEVLLSQREEDMHLLDQQREHVNTLIKMIKKITDIITVPEISSLESQHKANLLSVSLSKLVQVQPYSSEKGVSKIARGPVLWYALDQELLGMAKEMHEMRDSNLMLSLWVEAVTAFISQGHGGSVAASSVTLAWLQATVWRPQLAAYSHLAQKIMLATVSFDELERALQRAGDRGEGLEIRRELGLMTEMLQRQPGVKADWIKQRFRQIQLYRRLCRAAGSASVVLGIAEQLRLQGDFAQLRSLSRLGEESFRQKSLETLTDDFIQVEKKLFTMTQDRIACLQEFMKNNTLICWVKANLQKMSDLKVFVDLAFISAGENDSEVDRVTCFHDAVMGYGSLIYGLPNTAGFKEFMQYVQPVWDSLERDKRLPQKLRDSSYWLDWLKGLRETHGSVEQSSLSLASAINAEGVYRVGGPETHSGKRTVQSLLMVKVRKDNSDRSYSLVELLELQNKLMLMSSKGDYGREQVNRFMEVFDGVQRLAQVLLHLHSSGNVLFHHWEALVRCSPGSMVYIQVTFPLPGKTFVYRGEVMEQLQGLCRSMEFCQRDWAELVGKARSQFSCLNYYTAEQIVHLCRWIFSISRRCTTLPQSAWHLLYSIKPDCTLKEVQNALALAIETKTRHTQVRQAPPTPTVSDGEGRADEQLVMDPGFLSERHGGDASEDMSELSEQEMAMEDIANGFTVLQDGNMTCNVKNFWRCFKADMPRYLGQNLDIFTLAQFLFHLSDMNQDRVRRKMPAVLQEGRPNLVLCPKPDVLSTALSFYMHSPQQPLPSCDEVLLCHEQTTAEEVELFLRRALSRGAPGDQGKIFTMMNAGLLTYDVSVSLGEYFELLEKSAEPRYRLIIVCSVNDQSKYVPSFFSGYKVQVGLGITSNKARDYLRQHFSAATHQLGAYPEDLTVWLITSTRPAVGKSLYADLLFERFQRVLPAARQLRIRLLEPRVQLDSFLKMLVERTQSLNEWEPVMLHIDATAVRFGLGEFLFQLLVLGCLSDSEGNLWRRNRAHLITVELLQPRPTVQPQTQSEKGVQGLLDILPTILCRSPKEVKELQLKIQMKQARKTLDPLMDEKEFKSEGVQRPYQYLKRYNRGENLDPFKYKAGSVEGDSVECLHYLLLNCGMQDPSWAELKNFTWFLNLQLKDCEQSMFCDPDFLAHHLKGFKGFIIKFMILMARDFATPSIDSSDQSPSHLPDDQNEDDTLARLTIRKKWETEPHPYIFFNADHISMSFLGFHIKKCPLERMLIAVHPQNNSVLMEDVMTPHLFEGLERQGISFSEDFDRLPREDKIQRISFVVGAKEGWIKGRFDPDPTYELTTDNVMKMLAIHMRFRCGIPVIIMGETGCGKTRLVRFLCDLQREGRKTENMKLIKVHGGTTVETIQRKVREAEALAEKNQREFGLDTILFFDEANTTESIFAIKEVLCDKTVQGYPLKMDSGLKIVAACNPYRKHSSKMVERLERAGLGYRVKAEETEDRLGKVPLRQLVYRVQPLPPSMIPLVWDFGQLSDSTELSYIRQIVKQKAQGHSLPIQCYDVISEVLANSQRYMRSRKDECSFVSLRDVERSMLVLLWFHTRFNEMFPNSEGLGMADRTLKCLALAVGVCYYPMLVDKVPYLRAISRHFPKPFNSEKLIEQEISTCQEIFLRNVQTRKTIAKNIALKENVFLMVVCIELRIPLFLVGKPGSSKSLAKTVVADAMQGQNSQCSLFRALKAVHMVSFQCSPHSSPEGIISTFRQCARFQQDKSPDKYVSVVVLDEIGLAEDSPQMPLKTLHPLLEDGCIDNDTSGPHMKVGFVGISNWALDPAKMNRGIFVSRWDPSENELVETAKGICSSDKSVLFKIQHLFPQLAKAFLKICRVTDKTQFFGLRDYYSLVKMIFAVGRESQQEPSDSQLAEAILRNFSGQPKGFDPLQCFQELFQNFRDIPRPSTLQMVERNLDCCSQEESRYLLLLTTNNAALHILQQCVFAKVDSAPEIIFGSGFPKDQEYANVCRNVNRVKTCMETGRTVILLNLQNLYESLYDALNQYYVYLGGQQYVDLGLGTHRVKCRVHREFRLVVVEDQDKVYQQFPVPLINRMEKHHLDRSADLTVQQRRVLLKLMEWVEAFTSLSEETDIFDVSDAFAGFHDDACASALLQALEEWAGQRGNIDGQLGMNEDTVTKMVISGEAAESDSCNILSGVGSQGPAMADTCGVAKDERPLAATGQEGEVTVEPADNGNKELGSSKPESSMETETCGGNTSAEEEEEEVFEAAKRILLNCATPEAVLRLKYSKLGSRERALLQERYFREQRHSSLKAFLKSQLSDAESFSRFVEVTTFSSLLTRSDIQALGVPEYGLLLLSLHQFDTEASFCSKIRCFIQDVGPSAGVLLIQTDMEESAYSNELIASAKYCTMNELNSQGSGQCRCHLIFITKLSRMRRRFKYTGFQGGVWLSVHIDDLRETEDMSSDVSTLCGTPFSKLLTLPVSSEEPGNWEEEMNENQELDPSAQLHTPSLLRSCIQRAVSHLKDPESQAPRSMKRVQMLLGLLEDSPGQLGVRFMEVLLRRLVVLLAQWEEMMLSPGEWVSQEARKQHALQEGGTLRHTLWCCLQNMLTPVLAQVLEVLDRDANLDLLCCEGVGEGLVHLWLDILEDQQTLVLAIPPNLSMMDKEIPVQYHILLDGEEHPCAAPFSWLIRMHSQSLWEESELLPDTQVDSGQRAVKFSNMLASSRLGRHLMRLSSAEAADFGRRYLCDFVLMSFRVSSQEHLMVLTTVVQRWISELQQHMSVKPGLSPAWILAAVKLYAPRLDTLNHLLHLQPSIIQMMLQKGHDESSELLEDVLALGVCVEKLQQVKMDEHKALLRRVELLQPCVERAFGRNFSALCSPGCLQQLEHIRAAWRGVLVVTAFIQQVVLKLDEPRLKAVAMETCAHLHKLMQQSSDLRKAGTLTKVIDILNECYEQSVHLDFRHGTNCPVCLAELQNPVVLACGHTFCLNCLKSLQNNQQFCPMCRARQPTDFKATVSDHLRSSLQQLEDLKRLCNAFFLEVVSRFSLSEGEQLQAELVELLFSLLISEQDSVYSTRELTPFLNSVDLHPVVRSVFPKLLLQYSFEQVKDHIQSYLGKLEDRILDREDLKELYLLFVNCFQDSLYSPGGAGVEVEQCHLLEGVQFLSRLASREVPGHRDNPAEFLLCMAKLRLWLGTAACLLQSAVALEEAPRELEARFLNHVKRALERGHNDWHRIYLLRAVHQLAGVDCVKALVNSPRWAWVFPAELLQPKNLIPVEVDWYLCCGQPYRVLRDEVCRSLLESDVSSLNTRMQHLDCPRAVTNVLLSLALFRQVTCCLVDNPAALPPTPEAIASLADFLRRHLSGELQDLCAGLLDNKVGGVSSPLRVMSSMPAPRRTLLEVLVHAAAVFLSGGSLVAPLYQIAFQPQTMKGAFLPTMPDDHSGEARQWMSREGQLKTYTCRNGHLCFVGECGKPVQLARCAECNAQIGGQNHKAVDGFTLRESVGDNTRVGHILGDAPRRSDAPERQLSMAAFHTLRLCTHLAMMLGTVRGHQEVSEMIQPTVTDVQEFLWGHLERDMMVLGQSLGQNMDNTAMVVHLVLHGLLEYSSDSKKKGVPLSSRKMREEWEKRVCDSVINLVLQQLDRKLREAQAHISADDNLNRSPMMKLLYADPASILSLPSECPTDHSSFWNVPEMLTVERFSQILDQNQGQDLVPLLSHFIKKAQCIRQLCHLPTLAALQLDLLRWVPLATEAGSSASVRQILQEIPAGRQKEVLQTRVKVFFDVWNQLRMELARSPETGVTEHLCRTELTMDSPGELLSLSRIGPGSSLGVLISFLSETHNSLVRQARNLSLHEDSDYSVPLECMSETQLVLCHTERELLPLLLTHRQYTLKKGKETASSYNLLAIESELARRFINGKPLIQADTSKYVRRHQQDFSTLLAEVRSKIPQKPLKSSISSAVRTVLHSFADVCDSVLITEVAMRFLSKAGGDPQAQLLAYVRDTLRMEQQISKTVAKALGESRLEHCTSTWQLLTCWKSELMASRGQDPFEKLPAEYRIELSEAKRKEVKAFLRLTDVDAFCRELHEILLLKTCNAEPQHNYPGHYDIRSILEEHLEMKNSSALPGFAELSEELTLGMGPEIWRLAVEFNS